MSARSWPQDLPRVRQDGAAPDALPVRVDPILTRVCCGQSIEPQLAEVRDRSGQTFFATVWYCPRCRRVTF